MSSMLIMDGGGWARGIQSCSRRPRCEGLSLAYKIINTERRKGSVLPSWFTKRPKTFGQLVNRKTWQCGQSLPGPYASMLTRHPREWRLTCGPSISWQSLVQGFFLAVTLSPRPLRRRFSMGLYPCWRPCSPEVSKLWELVDLPRVFMMATRTFPRALWNSIWEATASLVLTVSVSTRISCLATAAARIWRSPPGLDDEKDDSSKGPERNPYAYVRGQPQYFMKKHLGYHSKWHVAFQSFVWI